MTASADAQRGTIAVGVTFDRPDRHYAPGALLAVSYAVRGIGDQSLRGVEHTVAWYTEGKGEEDLGVHHFERVDERDVLTAIVADGGSFRATLPVSPLSYEGVIVKIRWCVRVRLFLPGGRDFVSEHVFDLGAVPPARPPTAEADA